MIENNNSLINLYINLNIIYLFTQFMSNVFERKNSYFFFFLFFFIVLPRHYAREILQ